MSCSSIDETVSVPLDSSLVLSTAVHTLHLRITQQQPGAVYSRPHTSLTYHSTVAWCCLQPPHTSLKYHSTVAWCCLQPPHTSLEYHSTAAWCCLQPSTHFTYVSLDSSLVLSTAVHTFHLRITRQQPGAVYSRPHTSLEYHSTAAWCCLQPSTHFTYVSLDSSLVLSTAVHTLHLSVTRQQPGAVYSRPHTSLEYHSTAAWCCLKPSTHFTEVSLDSSLVLFLCFFLYLIYYS